MRTQCIHNVYVVNTQAGCVLKCQFVVWLVTPIILGRDLKLSSSARQGVYVCVCNAHTVAHLGMPAEHGEQHLERARVRWDPEGAHPSEHLHRPLHLPYAPAAPATPQGDTGVTRHDNVYATRVQRASETRNTRSFLNNSFQLFQTVKP
eukprot:1181711-Prorocentrum_minimum.AAC.3